MSQTGEPLRLAEVGAFGELSARPNPSGYVVLTVPDFDEMLPHLEKQRGRSLTVEEIELERNRAPSIVLTKEQAEKMAAARASRG